LRHGAGEVRDGFADAETDLVTGLKETRAAELGDTRLEADSRPQRRLFEDEGDELVPQGICELPASGFGFEASRLVQ